MAKITTRGKVIDKKTLTHNINNIFKTNKHHLHTEWQPTENQLNIN